MDYQVDLEVFHGPMDLLLYLVKRDEIDLRDLPIARVAEQFLQYLDVVQMIDVEMAGDFLVMAGTLTELKSRMVLPRDETVEVEAEDPRQELVRQLLEYKQFKDAAALLDEQAQKQALRLPREPAAPEAPTGPAPLRPVELWDLVSAFGRLLRETLALQPQQITVDPTPLHIYAESVLERLNEGTRVPLSAVFAPPYTRARLVGYFLAVLELTRRFRVFAEQDDSYGDIWLTLAPKELSDGLPETTQPQQEDAERS